MRFLIADVTIQLHIIRDVHNYTCTRVLISLYTKLVCKSRLSMTLFQGGIRNNTSERHFLKYDCGNMQCQLESDIKIISS